MNISWISKLLNLQEQRTLVLNLAQVLGMINFAFGIPLVIGFDKYGLYAACFAVPATISVLGQSLFFALSANGNKETILHYFLIMLLAVSPSLLIIYYLILGWDEGLYASIIYFSLLSRVFLEAILLCYAKDSYLQVLLRVEIAFAFLSSFFLMLSWWLGFQSVVLPISLLFMSCVVVLFFTIPYININNFRSISFVYFKNNFRMFFKGFSLRFHEESFVTTMPLLIAYVASNELAGQFRVGLSFAKAMTKVMPYRYEFVFYSVLEGTLDKSRILKMWFSISFIYVSLIILGLIIFYWSEMNAVDYGFALMLLSGPVVAFLLIFMPVVIQLAPSTIYVVLICFALCAASAFMADLNILSITFVSTQVILILRAIKVIGTALPK